MDPDSLIVVSITTPVENAEEIAKHLVDNRLAACVNIVPRIRSVYRWEGKVEEDDESLLLVKTTRFMFSNVSSAVREKHPFAVPEILATPVAECYQGYSRWVCENVRSCEDD